jgi:DNA polymerase zeta
VSVTSNRYLSDIISSCRKKHKYLDAHYYILQQLIPPLSRIFDLVGADVAAWYQEMPRNVKVDQPHSIVTTEDSQEPLGPRTVKGKIDEHFRSQECVVCRKASTEGTFIMPALIICYLSQVWLWTALCQECQDLPSESMFALLSRLHLSESRRADVQRLCASCSGSTPGEDIKCESIECPWMFQRHRVEAEVARLKGVRKLISELQNH